MQRKTAPSPAQAAQASPGGSIPAGPANGPQSLSETGSTLLFPVLRSWAAAYRQQHANVSAATAATGSGKGHRQGLRGPGRPGDRGAHPGVAARRPGSGGARRPGAGRRPGWTGSSSTPSRWSTSPPRCSAPRSAVPRPGERCRAGRRPAASSVRPSRGAGRPAARPAPTAPAGRRPTPADGAGRGGQQRPPEDLGMTTGPGAAACPNCGRAVAATDNFCEGCRTELAPAAVSGDAPVPASECPACHSAQITADGYCESCGRKQPAGRDHIELDLGLLAGVTDKGLRHSRNEDAMALATAERPATRSRWRWSVTGCPARGARTRHRWPPSRRRCGCCWPACARTRTCSKPPGPRSPRRSRRWPAWTSPGRGTRRRPRSSPRC